MLFGLVADIHEETRLLARALSLFDRLGVGQVIVLGDIFETGRCIEPTVKLLVEADAVGVWGNHDIGFCHEPTAELLSEYPEFVKDFMLTLRTRWEWNRYLMTHALPTIDATDPVAYYLTPFPGQPGACQSSFEKFPGRVLLMGHYHQWFAATPSESLAWRGAGPLDLAPPDGQLVVVNAVMNGWCATLDTDTHTLTPYELS